MELETYTPQEAEVITGVPQTTVRNWRRAGYLERHAGHARYTVADLLVIYSMGMLVDRGITVKAAQAFAPGTARAIFQSLLYRDAAYAPDLLGKDHPGPLAKLEAKMRAATEAEQAFGVAGEKTPDWLIIWADDSMEFLYDQDADGEGPHEQFFTNIQYDKPYVQGPVMMFCLGALAALVAGRLPRPAIKPGA